MKRESDGGLSLHAITLPFLSPSLPASFFTLCQPTWSALCITRSPASPLSSTLPAPRPPSLPPPFPTPPFPLSSLPGALCSPSSSSSLLLTSKPAYTSLLPPSDHHEECKPLYPALLPALPPALPPTLSPPHFTTGRFPGGSAHTTSSSPSSTSRFSSCAAAAAPPQPPGSWMGGRVG